MQFIIAKLPSPKVGIKSGTLPARAMKKIFIRHFKRFQHVGSTVLHIVYSEMKLITDCEHCAHYANEALNMYNGSQTKVCYDA